MNADTLRALTVRQPHAWAIIHADPPKGVENRSRNIAGSYRGPVAIHAGLRDDEDAWDRLEAGAGLVPGVRRPDPGDMRIVRGAVLGVVDLVDVHHATSCPGGVEDGQWVRPFCSPWATADHHHLTLTNPRPLPHPVPARGRLGLWRPDADLTAVIREQIGDLR